MTAPGKHSPRPWHFEVGDHSHRYVRVADDDDRTIYYKYGAGPGVDADKDEANARLIAAAPDLLEDGWSLAAAALQSQRYAKESDFRRAVDAMLDTCRRARGEPTLADHVAAAKATGDAK